MLFVFLLNRPGALEFTPALYPGWFFRVHEQMIIHVAFKDRTDFPGRVALLLERRKIGPVYIGGS